jgi:hypothetical protein
MKEIQEYFKKHGYVVIRKFIDPEIAGLVYQYCITKVRRTDFMIDQYPDDYRNRWDGAFGDQQIPNSYCCYGEPLMDVLLANAQTKVEEYVGEKLVPTYSYWRFYQKNDQLVKHIDRDSCEISSTLCLGYNTSNIDKEQHQDYSWPMYVKDYLGEVMPVSLNPGDIILYKGCELEHWRDPYLGLNHAQVFLHYNRKDKEINNLFDGRPFLGLPNIKG